MSTPIVKPIQLDIKSAQKGGDSKFQPLQTFTSYSFERNILVPAAPFRFTAPGVDPAVRQAIRSGDMIELFAVGLDGTKQPIATGFIDETDTHVNPSHVEYVLTGRDTMGQLVDNAVVDAQNRVVQTSGVTLEVILKTIIANTKIPQGYQTQQIPNGSLLFQTNPGETKINALQRYLEITNCLIWSLPTGQLKIGKPNFTQASQGTLSLNRVPGSVNNLLEARVRRSVHTAIRQIVVQLQDLNLVDAGAYTVLNQDQDMLNISGNLCGRSVYETFTNGQGNAAVNQITQVGNSNGDPKNLGQAKALRELARDNMKIIEVEAVVKGHLNPNGQVFDVDQVYSVQIPDDLVAENMYVYSVSHELTLDHGMMTRLRLVRLGTIVVAEQLPRTT